MIPGFLGLIGKSLRADINLVYKDVQFYMIAVTALLLAFSFAVIYYPIPGEKLAGYMNRPVAAVLILLYGLYLFLQHQDTRDSLGIDDDSDHREEINPIHEWLCLMAGLLLIIIGVEGLLRSALGLGKLFNTPSSLWGLSVVAAGTSLPDLFISIKTARKGQDVVSLANVLGSNIFDLLVAVPAGILIAGASIIDFKLAAPLMGFLILATIILFTVLRTHLVLKRGEAVFLLIFYILFIVWMVLETLGVTSLVF